VHPSSMRGIDKAQVVKSTDRISIITLLSHRRVLLKSHRVRHMSPHRQPVRRSLRSRCNKANQATHRHLVNKEFENFLLLSVSFVLRECGLSERVGKMDRRSQ